MSTEQKRTKSFGPFVTVWAGQTVSLIGSGLTAFAMSVWLFRQTGNATPIALTALSHWIPRIVLAPIAGIVADRFSRKSVMIASDSFAALATGAAALLIGLGELQVWHIYLLAITQGTAGAFQSPAMTASVTLLVDKKDYTRAAGMQQTSAAVESIAAPIVAGLLLGVIGVVGVIVVDIATFLIGVTTLAIVHIPNAAKDEAQETRPLKGLKAALFGLSYVVKRKGLFAMLLYFALVNFSANMAAVLISPLVLSIGDSAGLGFVQMISGIGMLAGSVLLSISGGAERKMRMLYVAIFVSGLGLAATSLSPSLIVIAAGMFCMLFPIPFGNGAATAIWQTKVEPSVQGQVFAARGMISTVAMPLAFGLAGPLADRVFEPMMSSAVDAPRFFAAIVGTGAGRGYAVMLLLGGVMLVAATLVFAAYRPLRRVEEELPDVEIKSDDVAPAVSDATETGGPVPAQTPAGL